MVYSTVLTKYFGNVGIMHVRTSLQDLSTLILGPHHKGIHWSLYMWLVFTFSFLLSHNLG